MMRSTLLVAIARNWRGDGDEGGGGGGGGKFFRIASCCCGGWVGVQNYQLSTASTWIS